MTSHVNPDGDSIGSEIALYKYLLKKGKSAKIINYSKTPDNYTFLDKDEIIEQFDEEKHKDIISRADVIFILDTNEYARVRTLAPFIRESKAKKVMIDHHMGFGKNGFDYYISDTEAPSTGEILFRFFKYTGESIDEEIATALYTAIMTDTGSFKFERTDPETHLIAAELLGYGINPYKIYSEVYNKATPGKLKLLGRFLENIKLDFNNRFAYSILLTKDFEETGTDEYATDGYSQHLLSLESVVVGVIITQTKRGVKLSFRSKGTIPVNKLAGEFSGGGHVNAAGAFIEGGNVDELTKEVISKSEKYIK
ncbi:MAG TPA: bifunctional oligoribonuclease/PAP phosphatase NrnA [Ignavibacteria bacterium]